MLVLWFRPRIAGKRGSGSSAATKEQIRHYNDNYDEQDTTRRWKKKLTTTGGITECANTTHLTPNLLTPDVTTWVKRRSFLSLKKDTHWRNFFSLFRSFIYVFVFRIVEEIILNVFSFITFFPFWKIFVIWDTNHTKTQTLIRRFSFFIFLHCKQFTNMHIALLGAQLPQIFFPVLFSLFRWWVREKMMKIPKTNA